MQNDLGTLKLLCMLLSSIEKDSDFEPTINAHLTDLKELGKLEYPLEEYEDCITLLIDTIKSCMSENLDSLETVWGIRAVVTSFLGIPQCVQIVFSIYLAKTTSSVISKMSYDSLYEPIFELSNFYNFNVNVGTKVRENMTKYLPLVSNLCALEGNPLVVNQKQLCLLITWKYPTYVEYKITQDPRDNDEFVMWIFDKEKDLEKKKDTLFIKLSQIPAKKEERSEQEELVIRWLELWANLALG